MKPVGEKIVEGRRWPRHGTAAAVTLLALAAIAVALASISSARVGDRPTITGNPIVGETLTSSESDLYRWQRCDPAVASCVDAAANDSNWSDIAGARARTYTVAPTDLGFFIRVLTKGTNLGEQFVASAPVGPVTAPAVSPQPPPVGPVTAPAVAPQPPPVGPVTAPATPPQPAELIPLHGVQVLAEPVDGTVEVREPGQTAFSVLTELSLIPVGSSIDTRGSRVRLTAATGGFGSDALDHPVDFYAGLFKIIQKPGINAPATAKLVQKLACGKRKKRKGPKAKAKGAGGPVARTARKRKRRRVWGSGSGSYGTAGRGGTGSVVGTTWLTKDTCKGTLFKVTEGIGITVFDFKKKKKIKLGPGDKYFAAN
jgi:hypothetical protein